MQLCQQSDDRLLQERILSDSLLHNILHTDHQVTFIKDTFAVFLTAAPVEIHDKRPGCRQFYWRGNDLPADRGNENQYAQE